MAPASGVIWAVDVGNNLLKAMRLRVSENGMAEVAGFDNIEHSKFLGSPDIKPKNARRSSQLQYASSSTATASRRPAAFWWLCLAAKALPSSSNCLPLSPSEYRK